MAGKQPYRHDALPFGKQDPRNGLQLVQGAGRDRVGERDDGIPTFNSTEGDIDHVSDRVEPEKAEKDQRDRQSDAGYGEKGSHRSGQNGPEGHDVRQWYVAAALAAVRNIRGEIAGACGRMASAGGSLATR